jgi:hypothetical protein
MDVSSSGGNAVPDPHGAAGLSSLVAVTNSQIEGLRRDGSRAFGPAPLASLFGDVAWPARLLDTRVVYDVHRDRFVVAAIQTRGGNGTELEPRIRVAVSATGDPTSATPADWRSLAIRYNAWGASLFADYPGLGVDEEAVYVTANMFSAAPPADYVKPLLWIVPKDPLYNGAGGSNPGRDLFLKNVTSSGGGAVLPSCTTLPAGSASTRTFSSRPCPPRFGSPAGSPPASGRSSP